MPQLAALLAQSVLTRTDMPQPVALPAAFPMQGIVQLHNQAVAFLAATNLQETAKVLSSLSRTHMAEATARREQTIGFES